MSFAPMQKCRHGRSQRHRRLREGGAVRELQPRGARAGLPVSTVSRRVTALEERLGATLLQRTTRKLSLTAQGRAYYNQCSEPLSHLFDAERVLTETQKKPEGLLRSPRQSSLVRSRSMRSCRHS